MGNNQFGKLGIFSQQNLTIGQVGNMNSILNSNLTERRDFENQPFVNTPKLVECLSRNQITKVACGLIHSIAIEKNGSCFTWGSNSHGQLGRYTN